MTEKIREYSMNGALIIGVDKGYGNMKTARRCFKTAIAKYDSAPVLSRDYIEYDGGYYVIGEGRKAWTEKLGVFQCFQKIHNMVQDKTGDNLMDDVIDNILRSGKIELPEPHASLVEKAICDYVEEIFQKLRDHEYNEKLMKVYFMGGGARLVEQFGNYNPDTTIFNHDIRVNAKGYEYYCYMLLRHQSKSGRR